MHRITTALLAVVACAAALPAVAQESDKRALDALNTCIPRLDPQIDVGFERIAARCPDLARRLEASGWSAWLPAGWKESGNDLSAGSLRELRVLIQRELETRTQGRTPSVESLQEILADIGQGGRQREGLWARFRKWLYSISEADNDSRAGWLDRMVGRVGLPQLIIELVTYATLALIMALAVLIVVSELRATGVFQRKRSRKTVVASSADLPSLQRLGWAQVEQASLGDKPRLLLELVVDRLTQLRLIPPARSFTVRELARAAQLSSSEDRGRLTELALAAERVRYSSRELPPAALETAVERGRELLERLEGRGG